MLSFLTNRRSLLLHSETFLMLQTGFCCLLAFTVREMPFPYSNHDLCFSKSWHLTLCFGSTLKVAWSDCDTSNLVRFYRRGSFFGETLLAKSRVLPELTSDSTLPQTQFLTFWGFSRIFVTNAFKISNWAFLISNAIVELFIHVQNVRGVQF